MVYGIGDACFFLIGGNKPKLISFVFMMTSNGTGPWV